MSANILNKKKFEDVVANIGAYALPIAASNLLILPSLAAQFTPEQYGFVAAATSLINLVPRTMGKALNNVRLINDSKYDESNISKGDFSTLLFIGQAVSLLIVLIAMVFYVGSKDFVEIILVAAMALLWFFREYYSVTFRIELNFKRVFMSNLVLVAGYAFGGLAYIVCARWQVIYIVGQLASCIYIICHTTLHKERPIRSDLFKRTSIDYASLSFSEVLANVPTQFDKLILLPILGSAAISTYYAASVITKILSLVIAPLNSVVLSYISKTNKLAKQTFFQVVLLGIAASILCYALNYFLGDWILSILYPSYRIEAAIYIPMTALSAALMLFWSMIQPFAMRFGSLTWMMLVNAISSVAFLGVSFFLAAEFGIWAICIGSAISNFIKAFAFVFMCLKSIRSRS